MTTTIRLIPDGQPDKMGRQRYKPVKATVTGFSKYNPDEFSLSGVEGFWTLVPDLMEKYGRPKEGAVALWTLTTKPKTGPMAKPGSVYRDVVALGKVTDYVEPEPDEPEAESWEQPSLQERVTEAQSRTPRPHPDAIGPDDPVPPEWQNARSYYERRNRDERFSIQLQVAFKTWAELVTAFKDNPSLLPDATERISSYAMRRLLQLDTLMVPGHEPEVIVEPELGTDIDGPVEPAA